MPALGTVTASPRPRPTGSRRPGHRSADCTAGPRPQTITYTLIEADGGTDVDAVHENLPAGVAPEDNDLGWRISLSKLAALAESGS
ncbi:SRPBCC domain-containing protein [Nocardia sp. NPDC006044]|uniref:SRPBCC domain-containing protein n=1 Tax=Nocardia sp. NPDC006044 TaxID=3364306 RepID=UPI003686A4D6